MVKENMSKVQKLTVSAMVMALYVVVLYFTQSFSFGAYQIRIATALYALAYLFPFLVFRLVSLISLPTFCSADSVCWTGSEAASSVSALPRSSCSSAARAGAAG